MARTGFFTHASFLDHDTGPGHPERPDRLRAILEKVEQSPGASRLVRGEPDPVGPEALLRCHGQRMIDAVVAACEGPGRNYPDGDTVVSSQSLEAAYRAVGAGRLAADAIVAGEIANAFCAVRPPGHHATPLRSMGFCVFNSIALLAGYLQDQHGAERVLIVDWDVHHGNGTQDIFYEDPSVLYFSVHQFPHYPGTGAADETGAGPGEGTTINVPRPPGQGDAEYVDIFDTILAPAAERFAPDWVLISAGFDAHRDDPLAGMQLTAAGFAALTDRVVAIASRTGHGRCIGYLEGGYDLDGLADSTVAHIERLQAAAAA